MSLFNRVKQSAQSTTAPKSKGVRWLAQSGNAGISESIKELVKLQAQVKAIDAKMSIHKTVVKKYAEEQFVQSVAATGQLPDTPMVVQNEDGERVTYVAQDRCSQYKLSAEQIDALQQLLGKEAAEGLIYEEYNFHFDRLTLSIPGVLEAVDAALSRVEKKLHTSGVLPEGTQLLSASQRVTLKPGTFEQIALICGRDTGRIRTFLDTCGSLFTRYIRV